MVKKNIWQAMSLVKQTFLQSCSKIPDAGVHLTSIACISPWQNILFPLRPFLQWQYVLTLYYPDNIPERTHLRGNVYFDLVSEVAAKVHWSQCFWTMYSKVEALYRECLFISWWPGNERKKQKRARLLISPSREYLQRFNFLPWCLNRL